MPRIIQSDEFLPADGLEFDLVPYLREDFGVPIWVSLQCWTTVVDSGAFTMNLFYVDPTGQERVIPFGVTDLSDSASISSDSTVHAIQRQSATSDCFIRISSGDVIGSSGRAGMRCMLSDWYYENVGFTQFEPA